MANVTAPLVTAQEAGYSGSTPVHASDVYGKLRRIYFSVDVGPLDAGENAKLAKLPRGCKVQEIALLWEAMGTSAVLDVGITGDSARYANDLDVAAAGQKRLDLVKDKLPDATPIADDSTYLIATAGGANFADNKVLQGYVVIVVE